MTHTHHGIDYIELPAADLDSARSFYAAAEGTERPLVLLFSTDLDATLSSVKAAGGTILTGPYDFPGGRRFHFADPHGNELGVWSEA